MRRRCPRNLGSLLLWDINRRPDRDRIEWISLDTTDTRA